MKNNIISNTNSSHFSFLKSLFKSCTGRIIIVSPFLAKNMRQLFENFIFDDVKELALITTFKINDPEQLSKPFQLKDFFEFFMENYPSINISLHINNSLHGKIYGCINETNSSLVITSANFTNNGLIHNNEWGYLVNDDSDISFIVEDLYGSIDYFEVTYNQVKRACQFSDQYSKENPEWKKVTKVSCNILDYIYTDENSSNLEPNYFLKPIGTSEEPIKIEDQEDFSKLHQNLHFSKKKPNGVLKGDYLITTAVGPGSIISYFKVTGGTEHVTDKEIELDPSLERWPWYLEGKNQSQHFAKLWWSHNIHRQDLVDSFVQENPGVPITIAGGFTLGTLQWGNDKVHLSPEFGKYIIAKIDEFEKSART